MLFAPTSKLVSTIFLETALLSHHNRKQIDNPLLALEVYYKIHAVLSSKYESSPNKIMEISHVQ